jgi:hypothetical protein
MIRIDSAARAGVAAAVVFAFALVSACGKGSPSTPTPSGPRVNAPALASPTNGAEVSSLRPELTITNATSSEPGDRTYEFQVSSTSDFSGAAPAVLITKSGIAEGSGGQTSYTLEDDLKIATAYFWRARATQAGVASAWSAVGTFKTRTKAPPVVSISLPKDRADADEDLVLIAVVQSADTPAEQLGYEWTAEKGTITGSGRLVTWRAPRAERPGPLELSVTVTARYTVTNADGTTSQAENKVTAKKNVIYNDSYKEVREISLDFIGDFSNSNNAPEFCVRNFSNSCGGKNEEENDIRANRARVTIRSADYGINTITFNSDRTIADVVARCNFVSTVKATGRTETAIGVCQLQATYESNNWFLCDSKYTGVTTTSLRINSFAEIGGR